MRRDPTDLPLGPCQRRRISLNFPGNVAQHNHYRRLTLPNERRAGALGVKVASIETPAANSGQRCGVFGVLRHVGSIIHYQVVIIGMHKRHHRFIKQIGFAFGAKHFNRRRVGVNDAVIGTY